MAVKKKPGHKEDWPSPGEKSTSKPERQGVPMQPDDLTLSGPLVELYGLGQALSGLGAVVLGITERLRKAGETFPEHEIGDTVASDYHRLLGTNRLVRRPTGNMPDCNNSVVIDWWGETTAKGGCKALTGQEVQQFINQQIELAKTAAAALCTDPKCTNALTKVIYQGWGCEGKYDPDTEESTPTLWVQLQLRLECRAA